MKTRKWYVLLLLLLAAGCSQQGNNETKADRNMATIQVIWGNPADVDNVCRSYGLTGDGEFNGCARSKPGNAAVCEIYTTEPRNFEDTKALQVLGHEVYHCLGGTHKG